MMPVSDRVGRLASALFAVVPFAFGLVRAVRTGTDRRYLWVALASFVGSAIAVAAARSHLSSMTLVTATAAACFVTGTLCAVLMAMILGTRLNLGIVIVASGFGLCFAASGWLYAATRLPRTAR